MSQLPMPPGMDDPYYTLQSGLKRPRKVPAFGGPELEQDAPAEVGPPATRMPPNLEQLIQQFPELAQMIEQRMAVSSGSMLPNNPFQKGQSRMQRRALSHTRRAILGS